MRWRNVQAVFIASLLILSLLMTAGCTSIPGPEPKITSTPVKSSTPVTPQAKTIAIKTPASSPTTAAPSPAPVTQITPSSTLPGVYESRTCAAQGGAIAEPGEMCPGTWLIAPDTFSCCSVMPVTAITRNITVVIEPLDLSIVMDDDPGSILP